MSRVPHHMLDMLTAIFMFYKGVELYIQITHPTRLKITAARQRDGINLYTTAV